MEAYLKVFDTADSREVWFEKIKDLCPKLGYTPNVKEYKDTPEKFKGHVGDVTTVIRIALTSRQNSPDLHAIMNLLGQQRCAERMQTAFEFFKSVNN